MKIPTEDFSDETLAIHEGPQSMIPLVTMLEVVIGVVVMEVDKVVDEVTGMEFV